MSPNPPTVIFASGPVPKVDRGTIEDLKRRAAASPTRSVRLCLHPDTSDPIQQMIIVHTRGAYVRPHRHDTELESFHILDGAMLVILFDDNGCETDRFRMSDITSGESFLCRLPCGQWHTMIPLTEQVVFLETTQGPFRGAEHNTFAAWAPAPDDAPGIARFLERCSGSAK